MYLSTVYFVIASTSSFDFECVTSLQLHKKSLIMSRITVSWLTPVRFAGMEEEVCRSRIKSKDGNLIVGSVVPIVYKSSTFKAKIISLTGEFINIILQLHKAIVTAAAYHSILIMSIRKPYV